MGVVEAVKLVYKYIRCDEEENIEEVNHAIDGSDAGIQKGDFVAVLGRSGSGKSTFVRHINGPLTSVEGTVWVNDIDARDEERLWDVRETTGVVLQNPDNQIIGSIAEEDVGLGSENMGVPIEKVWKRMEESLKAVGMTTFRLQSPSKLSGGQKQRIATTGVMTMKPQCIILDKSMIMLDPNGHREVIKTIHELNRVEGITVLLITYYMEEATEADRIIVMDEGRIVMDRGPEEIFSRVRGLKERGLGIPQVIELACELREAGMSLSDGISTREQLVKEPALLIKQAQKVFEHWVLE